MRARRGLALLAASGVLGVACVTAGTAAPAEAGPMVHLTANPAFLLAGQTTTLTATAAPSQVVLLDWMYLFDTTTGTEICTGLASLGCSGTESQSVATTHAFVAYAAASGQPGNLPPLDIDAMSTPVTVTWEPVHRIIP